MLHSAFIESAKRGDYITTLSLRGVCSLLRGSMDRPVCLKPFEVKFHLYKLYRVQFQHVSNLSISATQNIITEMGVLIKEQHIKKSTVLSAVCRGTRVVWLSYTGLNSLHTS